MKLESPKYWFAAVSSIFLFCLVLVYYEQIQTNFSILGQSIKQVRVQLQVSRPFFNRPFFIYFQFDLKIRNILHDFYKSERVF